MSDAKGHTSESRALHDSTTSRLDDLESQIEAFEAAYARDLGAVMHALAAAEFLRDGVRQAMSAYAEAHRCAEAEHHAVAESLRRKEDAAGRASIADELLPVYLLAAERIRCKQAADRLRDCETRLVAIRRQSAGADAEVALFAERLATLRQQRDQLLTELRDQRVALLKSHSGAAAQVPSSVRTPIEEIWDDLPVMHGAASPGRDCQRCGEPVRPGRKRFCSRECCRLYMAANGSLENPKRSRFYDYGSDDLEDERWED
jgi:hypothetical protein